jgi:hypothetical protein
MDINSIQDRARYTFLVFSNDSGRTRTGFLWMIPVPTRAEVHRGDELKVSREVEKGICHRKVESGKTKPSQTMLIGWHLFTGVEPFAQDWPEASR